MSGFYFHGEAKVQFSATVDGTVVIGARTLVWQNASVIRNARIGEDCVIGDCACVDGSVIGDRSRISHGAFIDPGMVIGKDVFIGPNVALCNDFWPRVDKEGWFDTADLISGTLVVTRIEDGASIGANAVLMPGVTIGAGAMVAALACVKCDVPAGYLYGRDGSIRPIDPARIPDRKRLAA